MNLEVREQWVWKHGDLCGEGKRPYLIEFAIQTVGVVLLAQKRVAAGTVLLQGNSHIEKRSVLIRKNKREKLSVKYFTNVFWGEKTPFH